MENDKEMDFGACCRPLSCLTVGSWVYVGHFEVWRVMHFDKLISIHFGGKFDFILVTRLLTGKGK